MSRVVTSVEMLKWEDERDFELSKPADPTEGATALHD
jgi:hypothetical protein